MASALLARIARLTALAIGAFLGVVVLYPLWLLLTRAFSVRQLNEPSGFQDLDEWSEIESGAREDEGDLEDDVEDVVFSRGVRSSRWTSRIVRFIIVYLFISLIPIGLAPMAQAQTVDHMHLAFTPTAPGGGDDCSAGPVTETAPAGIPNQFVACVQDSLNAGEAGVLVTPTVESGVTGTFEPSTGTTDGSGRVTFTVKAFAAGLSTITATAAFASTLTFATNTITKNWTTGTAVTVTVEPPSDDNLINDTHTVTATVTDGLGDPVPNGTPVSFTVAGTGGETPTFGADTTTGGEANFSFTSTKTGTSNITATSGGATGTATKNWSVDLTLSHSTATNTVGEPHTVTATLSTGTGPAPDGTPITFTATGTGFETPTAATKPTVSGTATFTFTSTKTGTSTITADAGGGAVETATKLWEPDVPHFINLSPATDTNIAGDSHTVTATVLDQYGNPVVDGTVVTFTVTGAGAQVGVATTTAGIATFTFSSTQTGLSTISALAGVTGTATSWNAPVIYPVCDKPNWISVADFDNDGHLDLAVACESSDNITILLGDGSGGFTNAGEFAAGDQPQSIAVGHFDTDTNLDLAVANFASDDVTILVGDGIGNFTETAGSPIAVGDGPRSIGAGDFDGDGDLDLAVANERDDSVKILVGESGATFGAALAAISVGDAPRSLVVSQLNAGTDPDIAVANHNSDNVTVLLGGGGFAFSEPAGSPFDLGGSANGPAFIIAGDFDNEGDNDLATANELKTSISILLNNGSGTGFSEPLGSPFDVGVQPHAIATGDLNGDGNLDIAVASNPPTEELEVILGNGNGTFGPAFESVPSGGKPNFVALGDFDEDGKLDIAVTHGEADQVAILINNTPFALVTEPVHKNWVLGPPANVDLRPESAQNVANTSHTVTATVSDAFGNTLSGVTVTFTAAGTGFETPSSATSATDGDGVATFTFNSTKSGTSVITATANGAFDTATKEWIGETPTAISLEPLTATNTVRDTHTVTATVVDQFGNPVPNQVVTFTVVGEGATVATSTTNSQGKAPFSFNSPNPGFSTVTAEVAGGSGPLVSNEVYKRWFNFFPNSVTILPASDTNTIGFTHTVTVTVSDDQGNPNGTGITVTIEVTGTGSESPNSTVTATDGTGMVTFSFTSSEPGTSIITATSGTATDTATKAWELPNVDLEPELATNTHSTTHTMTATVTDADGNPMAGVIVTFTAGGTGAEDPDFATETTDANGVATFTFTSTLTGDSTITATVCSPGGVCGGDTATKNWHHGPPATVTVSPANATNTVGATHTITVTAVDAAGNPIANHPATMSVTGPGSLEIITATSADGDGVATFTFTSTQTGISNITVTVTTGEDGGEPGEGAGHATKTWTPGPVDQVSVTPQTATNTVGDTHTVTATVRDEHGNRVADGTLVTFTVSGTGGESPKSGTDTTTAGEATFTFTSTKTGTSRITATANGSFGTATKNWLPQGASTITLEPPTDTNGAGQTHTVTATATDQFGNNVADGTVVTFTVVGAGAQTGTSTTDDGKATFGFTSTQPGFSTITASISGETQTLVSNQVFKTWHHGAPFNVSVTPPVATNTVDSTHTVTATATDQFGNPIANHGVTVTVSGPGATAAAATTTASGTVVFSFHTTQSGTSQITIVVWSNGSDASGAGAGIATGTATKLWRADVPSSIVLSPETATNTAGSTHTVTATVRDKFGNPVNDGTTVTFTAVGTGFESPPIDTETTLGGVATFTFTSTKTGVSTVTATTFGTQTVFSNAVTKTWVPGPPENLVLSPQTATNTVGETHTVTALVTDEFGNLVPDGTIVTFTASGTGGEDPSFGTDTTVDGVATFTFTSTQSGTTIINATAGAGQTPTFAATNYATDRRPLDVVVGDFDGDGDLDLATANEMDDNVSILLNNGDGSFSTHTDFAAGDEPKALAVGDYNGDGDLDLAVANGASDNVSILLGNGDGTFDPPTNFGAGDVPSAIAAGDYDGDGDLDLAVANRGSDNVSILLGNGSGGFGGATNVGVGDGPVAIAQDDFDGDGDLDLALANHDVSGSDDTVSILLGNGSGGFASGSTPTVQNGPSSIVAGDFDEDGNVDLAVANENSSSISILIGNGNGTFATASNTAVSSQPHDIATGDLNGDGHLDIAIGRNPNGIEVILGEGDGTFGSPFTFPSAVKPSAVAMGDFDADGKLDIVSSNENANSVTVFLNTTKGFAADTATKNWIAGPPSQIRLEPATDTNPAGTTHTVTATLSDSDGNPAPDGTVVTFTVIGQAAQVGTSTTIGGEANFSFSTTGTGTSTITASAQGQTQTLVSDPVTKNWHHAAPDSVVVTPPSGSNIVGQTHTVTGTATDEFGNPIASHSATLTVSGAGAQIQTSTTNANGVVVFNFNSTQAGTSQITITVWSNGSDASGAGAGSAFGTATKTWSQAPAGAISLEPQTDTNPAGTTHTVTASVTDTAGGPVADGTVVTFTVTGQGARVGTSTTTGGKATFQFSTTGTGSSTITASVQGTQTLVSNAVTKTWHHAAPFQVVVTPTSGSNVVQDDHTITATATDQFGNPIADHGATLTVTGAGPQTDTAITDGNGVVTFTFTSNQEGTSEITITVWSSGSDASGAGAGSAFGTATKNWTGSPPNEITLEPQNATNSAGTTHTVTATVTNTVGGPAADGTVVTFTVTGAGGPKTATSTTFGGKATFQFSSTQTGSSTITASVGSLTSNAVTKNWHHAAPFQVVVTPPSGSNPVGQTHTVTGTATDQFGNPIANHGATLTVTGAGAQTKTGSTNGSGVVVFSFVSTQTGPSQITITVWSSGSDASGAGAGSASGFASKDWTVGPAATITLEPPTDTNPAGTSHTVTATVTDQFGNNVADGTQVTFTVVGPGATQGVRTTTGGKAVFTFSSTDIGTSTITASVGTLTSSPVTKVWKHAGPSSVVVTQATQTNTVGDTHTVTATAEDQFGNPVGGAGATLTVTGAGAQVKTGTTDANGVVVFTFVSTQVGTSFFTVTVWSDGSDGSGVGSASDSDTKNWIAGPADRITLEPTSASNNTGDTHTVTATVRDRFGNIVTTPTVVTFTVIGRGASTGTDTTSGGQATFEFVSTETGVSTATATAEGPSGTIESNEAIKFWAAPPASISLEPPTATNAAGDVHTVTATVLDEFNNPAADGTVVTFTVVGQGATAGTSVVSGGQGKATFGFTSTQTGSSTITAVVQGETQTFTSNAVTKTWKHGAPANVIVVQASATNTVGDTHTVTGTATDQFGNPISNKPATLTVTGVGAQTQSGTTDANGVVVFTFVSTQAGTSQITITVFSDGSDGSGAGSASGTTTKQWIPGQASQITLEPDVASNPIGTTHTITATVRDQNGNLIGDGQVVTFTVIGQGAGVGTDTTTNGQATFQFTSTQSGVSTATATTQGGTGTLVSNQAIKFWSGPAATITLEPPTATNGAGDAHTVTATVTDEFGNAVADGTIVTFTVIGEGATVGVSILSGGQGQTTFSFTSTQTGSSTITASVQGTQTIVSNAVSKTWHHGPPALVVIGPAVATEFEGNTVTFVATATDQFGNAVSNHDLDFSKSGKPGTVPSSTTTDGNGVVTFSVYSTTTGITLMTLTVSSDGSDASGAGAGTATGNVTITWVGKRFTSLPPVRILDTRPDNETGAPIGICSPSPCASIPPGGQIEIQITGQGGVPASGVGAVKLNATIDLPTHSGFLTLFPKGQTRPVVSNLNFVPGDVRANLATIKVGTDGRIMAYNGSSGFLDVIFDVAGWYGDGTEPTQGGSFVSLDPERALDTRDGTGGTTGPIPPDGLVTLSVLGVHGVPASRVTGVVLNVTVDDAKAPGFLTVYPAGQSRPLASNVNFTEGRIVPNLVAIKAGTSGQVVLFNGSPNTIEMVADMFGFFTAPTSTFGGGSIEPIDPVRILDTRAPNESGPNSIGTCTPSPCAAIPNGTTMDVQVAGLGGVPITAAAVVMNVTVDQPTHRGFLTIFPAGQAVPLISNLNFEPGQTVPNLVMMRLSPDGKVTVYNGTSGTLHVIFDVNGWYRPILQ